MFPFQWLASLKQQLCARSSRNIRTQRTHRRQNLAPFTRALVSRNAAESLEDRTLLTAFTVVNTNDSGEGSLREAIEAANANSGADTISFDASLAGQTIVLTEEMLISDDLTITGLGADLLTLDGNGDSRIFRIDDGGFDTIVNVEISGLTLTNGYAEERGGGAILNYEDLAIKNSNFTGNTANNAGGAISHRAVGPNGSIGANRLSISDSTFSQNTSNSNGGAISLVDGAGLIERSVFTENTAVRGGGAIINGYEGTLIVQASMFTENSSGNNGGAISNSGEFSLINSTVSRNSTFYQGGGIYKSSSGVLEILNSTIVLNEATSRVSLGGGVSGGTYTSSIITNSIISGNTAAKDSQIEGDTVVTSSIISDRIDGVLESTLEDNGGPTLTHALLPGSSAINAGINSYVNDAGLSNDQRGTGYQRIFDGTVDIGAFEFNTIPYLVDTLEDVDNGDYSRGDLSLREAIGLSNADPDRSIIVFDQALAGQTILLNSELFISTNIIIFGLGANQLTLNGNGNNRIFHVNDGDSSTTINVEIIGLTLTNGYANNGGAILSYENLTVQNSTLTENTAQFAAGAIYSDLGALHIANCTISENSAMLQGGVIYYSSGFNTLLISGSTFAQNSTLGSGGAIFLNEGVGRIESSSFTKNSASGDGGAIQNHLGLLTIHSSMFSQNYSGNHGGSLSNSNELLVINSTLSENEAHRFGGGIYSSIDTTLEILNSTIVLNQSTSQGGAVYSRSDAFKLTNSIIAGNTAVADPQISGGYTNNSSILSNSVSGLIDPVLRDNGGPTKTHALLAGSPAINAGENDAAHNSGLTSDQRGTGYSRVVDRIIDLGAYEFHEFSLVVDSLTDEDDGDYSRGQFSLREAIRLANELRGANTITFAAMLAGQTIFLNSELQIMDHLTIIGLGADQLTLDGNKKSRIFNIDDGSHNTLSINVEITGLTLTNGFSDEAGGAIFCNESLYLSQVSFISNQSTWNGGAIGCFFGTVSAIDSCFLENSTSFDGGAIYNGFFGELNVSRSQFVSNSARNGGGVYSTGYTQLSISNSTFTSNHATLEGGGIYNSGNLLIEETTISGNTALQGGGLSQTTQHFSEFEGVVKNSTISNNTATDHGGGISNSGNLTIINSTLSGNHSGNFGGAISQTVVKLIKYIQLSEDSNTITVSDLNPGDSIPQWISVYKRNYLKITHSTITGNSAEQSGGGIATLSDSNQVARNTITITNSIIAGNTADSSAQVEGTFFDHTNLIQDSIEGLLDPVLRDNGGPTKTHALVAGSAAINAGSNAAANAAGLANDQRGTGYARIFGGTVDIGAFEVNPITYLVDTLEDEDDGDYSSGNLSLREAIKLANMFTTHDSITFDASLAGQTIVLTEELVISDDLTIIGLGADQLTISGNSGTRIFNVDDGDAETTIEVFLSGLTLMEGYAENGGAILNNEILSITDSTISANEASLNGGGIYHAAGLLTVTDTLFTDNRADQDGGGVYNSTQDLDISGSTFLRNIAERNGGGVYTLQGVARYRIKEPEVVAGYQDAPIYITRLYPGFEYQYNLVTITDTRFIENSAQHGGGLYSGYTNDPTTSNNSGWCGTTILLLPPSVIEGATENVNTERTKAEFFLTGSTFSGNSAVNGGGFYHTAGLLEIKRITVHDNSASYSGGGIANFGNLVIEESTLSENTAYLGGGIFLRGSTTTIKNSTLSNNSAIYSGGGIFQTDGSSLLLTPRDIAGSNLIPILPDELYSASLEEATQDSFSPTDSVSETQIVTIPPGNYLCLTNIVFMIPFSKLNIINSTITGNSARHSGGGIATPARYNRNTTTTISNSIVAGNTAASSAQVEGTFAFNSNIIQDSIEGLLDPVLRDNGGPTKTHALLAGSVAINGGDNAAAEGAGLTNDQRGDGSSRVVDGSVDIGAFEVQAPQAQIDLRVVKSKTPTSGNGESASLPENITWIDEWGNYWVEIWLSTPDTTDLGILSANLNLTYNTEVTTATSIEYGAAFTENQTGTINDQTGTIENLSAETSLADVGDDQRVLFARIKFESTADDAVDLDLSGQGLKSRSLGLSISQPEIVFVGGAPSEEVHGPVPTTQIWVNPYDLNDDDTVNIRDLLIFLTTYHSIPSESNSSYSWITDLNRNDRVDFRDFSLLIRNYGKSKANQSPVNYPQNYRDAWNQLLTVDSLSEPQHHTNIVTQSAAETVLESVVKQVSPQLTSSQAETLEQVDIEVVDLAGDTLGRAAAGTIFIDVNAAGRGWFVDDTPFDHSEFAYDSELTLIALPESAAANGVDLWTVIVHELGHLLGYNHETDGVMQESLAARVRRLPDWSEETDSFFSTLSGESELLPF